MGERAPAGERRRHRPRRLSWSCPLPAGAVGLDDSGLRRSVLPAGTRIYADEYEGDMRRLHTSIVGW